MVDNGVEKDYITNMPELGCPPTVPLATAAAICGISRATFASLYVESGLVRCGTGRGASRQINLAALEAATGRRITCQALCLAERARDEARLYQRQYRVGRTSAPCEEDPRAQAF